MPQHEACRLDQLAEGRGLPVRIGDQYLAVFLVDGRPRVLDNQCLHLGSPLDGGFVDDGCLTCPWHGWTYDVVTGDLVTSGGRLRGIRVYRAAVVDGTVLVTLDD